VVYWHISGDKKIDLPLKSSDLTVMENLGKEIQIQPGQKGDHTVLPVGNRRYIKTGKLTKNELIAAFNNAEIIN